MIAKSKFAKRLTAQDSIYINCKTSYFNYSNKAKKGK